MNKKIRFAVIGCGHIGKRHAEMITRDEGAELVALCDIRPKEELGIEAYAVPFARDIDELFRLGLDIDVVNICTPNGLHAEMAIQAIESGHHVVIEKPMALTLADAEKVVYTSLRFRKQVFCVMQNRYSPPSVWIKEMVESGKLGQIYMVQLNCYWNRDERYYNHRSSRKNAALILSFWFLFFRIKTKEKELILPLYQKLLLVLLFVISQTLKIEANEKRFENRSYHSRSHHHSDVPSSFRLPGKDSRHCKNRRQQDA